MRTFIIQFYFGSGPKCGSARAKSSGPDRIQIRIHNTALRSQLFALQIWKEYDGAFARVRNASVSSDNFSSSRSDSWKQGHCVPLRWLLFFFPQKLFNFIYIFWRKVSEIKKGVTEHIKISNCYIKTIVSRRKEFHPVLPKNKKCLFYFSSCDRILFVSFSLVI